MSDTPIAPAADIAPPLELSRRTAGMVTLRGDLSAPWMAEALKAIGAPEVPGQRRITGKGEMHLAWMSPDELLLLCPRAEAAGLAAQLAQALEGRFALAADVSDARVLFEIDGAFWREALATLAPVDFDRDVFGPGEMRRTRLAQVPAAIWCEGRDRARLVCFRSVASYVFDVLQTAAEPYGAAQDAWP